MVDEEKMCREDRPNYTYSQAKPKYSEENLFQCHIVHKISKMGPPGMEPASPM
jgi:hypothetical protein